MQVSIESLEGLQRKLTVEVPSEKIANAIEKKLKQISKTVKMDGFRPGKVPARVVKQTYGAQIRQEVMGDMIESSYREAIIQEKLRPAGMPQILPLKDAADKEGLAYSATFEVYPEITAVEIESIEIEKPVAEVSAEDLDNMIKKLTEQRKEWVEVERASVTGDQVVCDFTGKIDGESFTGGSGKDMSVEIGAGKMLKEFEEGLVGMSKGEEKTIDVHFPEDYHGKDVAGKTAQFSLTVTKVSESKIPELNEELIKSFGVEDGNLETFRQDIKQNMEKELAQKIRTGLKNKVMVELLAKNEVLAPKALVDDEIRNLKAQMAQNMGQEGAKMNPDSFPDDIFQEEGAKRVKLGLLVGEFIKIEKIKLDQTRLNEALQEMAASYEQPQQVIDYYTKNKEARANLEGMVLEDQVVDYILDKAKVSDKTSSFDELMNSQSR
ncbi:MAG: trigger factor [Gammaproteobacteria bacterium]|nr:trigger factor [Gammaproteobacteria bacterium]MBL6998248.1 trigger factor [Gammaproteobacteria bacterium]